MYWLDILISLVKKILWTLTTETIIKIAQNTKSQRALFIFSKIKARKENNEYAGQKHLFPQLDQYGKVRACCCQGFCCLSGLGTARLLWRLGIVTVCLCQSLHSKVTVSLYFILISHPNVCCVCTLHLSPSQGLSKVKSWEVMKWFLYHNRKLDHLLWSLVIYYLFLCYTNIFTFFNVKHIFSLSDFLLQIWKILEIFSETLYYKFSLVNIT